VCNTRQAPGRRRQFIAQSMVAWSTEPRSGGRRKSCMTGEDVVTISRIDAERRDTLATGLDELKYPVPRLPVEEVVDLIGLYHKGPTKA
jgi:hypothetical protein